MLKKLLLVAAAIGLTCAAASSKVIKSPAYDFRKHGIWKVSAVEQTKDATRVTFKAKYKPKWWIRVDTSEVFIHLPETGEVVKPLSYDCDFKFNDKFVMPESGEHEFTLTYPPLPKGVKKIDTGSGWAVYGIDLSGKKKKSPKAVKTTPYHPIKTIFASDSITVSGRIDGYDPRCGINVMELDIKDIALGKHIPVAIPVNPDGTFKRHFYLPMAQLTDFKIQGYEKYFPVYLEPENNLEILIDYDRMIEQSATDDPIYPAITFGGSMGTVNKEINGCHISLPSISHTLRNVSPAEAKQRILHRSDSVMAGIDEYAAQKNISPKSAQILHNYALADRTEDLLSYAGFESGSILPEDFYTDFLKEVLTADSTILASKSYFLLNRLAFCDALPESRTDVNVNVMRRLLDASREAGVEFNEEEQKQFNKVANFESPDSIQDSTQQDFFLTMMLLQQALQRADKMDYLTEIYSTLPPVSSNKKETNRQFIQRITGSEELPALWQFAVTAKNGRYNLQYLVNDMDSVHGITNQYLIDHITEAAQPKPGARKLPDTPAGMLMQRFIEPYRGKYLLVDFWDIFCGPCRAGIEGTQEMRELHRGNPGFAILFICSEKGSPLEKYNAYVEKHLKGENILRLPEEQIIMMRELFEFNGIPRYILFNPDGDVVDSDFSQHGFWNLLKDKGIINELTEGFDYY